MEKLITPPNAGGTKNYFLTIWYKPRETIRDILDEDPRKHVLLLALISGIYQGLQNAEKNFLGDELPLLTIVIPSLILGAFWGIISLFVVAKFLKLTGPFFGGTDNTVEIRTAVAWGSIPDVVMLIIFVFFMVIFGRIWFRSSPENNFGDSFITAKNIFLNLGLLFSLLKFILTIKCLSEVHEISFWEGLGSVLFVVIPAFFILNFFINAVLLFLLALFL